jgi:hypothetical protein
LLDATVAAVNCGMSAKDSDSPTKRGASEEIGSGRKRAKHDSLFSESDVTILRQVFVPTSTASVEPVNSTIQAKAALRREIIDLSREMNAESDPDLKTFLKTEVEHMKRELRTLSK